MDGTKLADRGGGLAAPARYGRRDDDDGTRLIVSYLLLRRTVGWIGTLLPVVLITGNAIFYTTSLPSSMSAYYYTHMRNVLVGALCVLGIFLMAYDANDATDRWITNVAGLSAFGVAFFPCKPLVCAPDARVCLAPLVRHLSVGQQAVGDVHLFFGAVLFIALGLMALRFAALARTTSGVRNVRIRHHIYRACGHTVLWCTALAAVSNVLPVSVQAQWPLVFVFEALAVFAFGVSWFVEGETLPGIVHRRWSWPDMTDPEGSGP